MSSGEPRCDAIIVAAGSGSRLGFRLPKAFVPLSGQPLFTHALSILGSHPQIDNIALVVPLSMQQSDKELLTDDHLTIVIGGEERWISVRNGVMASTAPWVLIHDAARPFVTHAVIDALLAMRNEYQAVITATPVVDTIRSFSGSIAGAVINRDELIRVGTPQLFNREALLRYLDAADDLHAPPTDEAVLFQNNGIPVGIAWGDPKNFKITTKEDLELAEALLGGGCCSR